MDEYGERGSRLLQLAEDPNEIVAMIEWDSMEGIEAFVEESDGDSCIRRPRTDLDGLREHSEDDGIDTSQCGELVSGLR